MELRIDSIIASIAGILILAMPELLNYVVAVYRIIVGILGLSGAFCPILPIYTAIRPRPYTMYPIGIRYFYANFRCWSQVPIYLAISVIFRNLLLPCLEQIQ